MATPSFREIINDIKKGKFNPVYILYGTESYYVDMILKALEASVVAPEDRDFNYNLYYGQDVNIETVVNCAQQFPVMAPKKLVILKETQAMSRPADLEKAIPYATNPNPNTVFVVTYLSDKTAVNSLAKAAEKNGAVVFKSESPRDYQLPSHIRDYCVAHKFSIDEKSVNLLCDYVGLPLSKVFGEINKLFQIKGEDHRITPEDIENNIGISKDFNNFELVDALRTRNYPKCIAIIDYFEINSKNNPTVVTLSVIFNYFTTLTLAHFLPQKDDQSLYSVLKSKFKRNLDDLKLGMRNYPPIKAVNAIHHIREFDAKSKGVNSMQDSYALLRELIFKIMT